MSTLGVAAIGDLGSIIGFQAMQFELLPVQNPEDGPRQLQEAIESGRYAVLYVSERLAEQAADLIEEARQRALPALVVLPQSKASAGKGLEALRRAAQKAIGFDILEER